MLEKLTNIIREHTGDNSIVINEDMDLKADLGLNSLDLVNLACVVEDEFDIVIPTVEIIPDNFNSAQAMWEMIQKLQEEG